MNLKTLRKQLNKTQKAVAEELGIVRTKYARYESGESFPSKETLIKLADYFHTTIDYILDHDVPYLINKSQYSSKQTALIDEVESLSNEQCDRVLSYIHGMKGQQRINLDLHQ